MKRLGLFLLLAPFLTACLADDSYYVNNNTHYHQAPMTHSHADVHGHSYGYYSPPILRKDPHHYPYHANRQQHRTIQNKPLTYPNGHNIPTHGHD